MLAIIISFIICHLAKFLFIGELIISYFSSKVNLLAPRRVHVLIQVSGKKEDPKGIEPLGVLYGNLLCGGVLYLISRSNTGISAELNIPALATGEQALRWLRLVCEPIFAQAMMCKIGKSKL